MGKLSDLVYSSAYGFCLLFVALTFAWAVMLKWDFFYATWHDYGGIKEGIEKYGPENRYKVGFADTSREQRLEIFRQINLAVHSSGRGLVRISYESASSGGRQLLLREPEILHLQDVANLLDVLMGTMFVVFMTWVVLAVVYCRRQGRLPLLKYQAIGPLGVLLALGLCLMVFGAENAFNTLHVWVFPDEHQWFFYYQESLMSTMMLAPRLFAWIAGSWLLITVVVFLLVSYLLAEGVRLINHK